MIIRIRNESSRTFYVSSAGDPFYMPTVGGQPCNEKLEILPSFDAPCDGLVIPWAANTFSGLVVDEGDDANLVRFVVGTKGSDSSTDWLRLHDSQWEPIVEDQWRELGSRHMLGAIGKTVELELTFRDCCGSPMAVAADTGGDTAA